jgi:hypothetical protein
MCETVELCMHQLNRFLFLELFGLEIKNIILFEFSTTIHIAYDAFFN